MAKTQYLHLERVDLLRGIAILLVVAYHTQLYLFPIEHANIWNEAGLLNLPNKRSLIWHFNPIGNGWIGVQLFLMISGFLIHLLYLRAAKPFDASTFFSKRFFRIFPPYFLVLTFFFLAQATFSKATLTDFALHTFLIHNLFDKNFFGINPSFWSIGLEVQLYFLYPVFLLLFHKWKAEVAYGITFGLFVVFALISYLIPSLGNSAAFSRNPIAYWFVFSTGCYLANRFWQQQPIFKRPWLWWSIFYLLFLASKATSITVNFTLFFATLACASFFEAILYTNFPSSMNVLGINSIQRFIRFVGLCSYSLYLIHEPYLPHLLQFFNPHTAIGWYNKIQQVVFSWAVLLFIAYTLYELLERSSIKLGEYFRAK